jgi:hypothetical protein
MRSLVHVTGFSVQHRIARQQVNFELSTSEIFRLNVTVTAHIVDPVNLRALLCLVPL